MTDTAAADRIYRYGPSFGLLVILLIAITAFRYWGLYASDLELMFDEAQYWSWALEPAWGYFSKPPLIAWLIGVENAVCGVSEFCARSAVPILHFGTSLVIYALARRMFSPLVGFWSALMFVLLPGVSFSSRLITTDVPLLFCWAIVLYCIWGLREKRSLGLALVLGVAIGAGMLAKYAMIYVVLCLAVYVIIDGDARRKLWWPGLLLAIVVAVLMLVPNVLWNMDNGMITFLHTSDNANWADDGLFHFDEFFEFLGAQFGVFGPIPMAVFLVLAIRPGAMGLLDRPNVRFLYAFSVPVVAIILFQALMSRAHANWAAPTYVAGSILVAAFLIAKGWRRLLYLTLALHIVVQGAILLADSRAATLKFPFGIDPYYRVLGYKDLAHAVNDIFKAGNYGTLVTDWRRVTGTMMFNLHGDAPPIVTWPHPERPHDHYQLTRPLTAETPGPLLLVTRCNRSARLDAAFEKWRYVDTVITKGGPKFNWIFFLIEAEGPRIGAMPPPSCGNFNGDASEVVDGTTLPPVRP